MGSGVPQWAWANLGPQRKEKTDMNPANMNLAQRIAVAITVVVLALFLLMGGQHSSVPVEASYNKYESRYRLHADRLDVGQTVMDSLAILRIGGAATWLLGLKRRKSKPDEQKPAA